MTQKTEKPDSKRTSPLIWLKQITLYKSISPPEEIRTIPFTPGLNIIQGKSDDSEEVFESGHGNGKTTLCRLIRFCLGEKTFGQEHVVTEVRNCFPSGYVGAIIVVDGEEWSVLRTVGSHRREFAQKGISLADFAKAEDRPAYSMFLKRIQEVGLSRLQQKEVLSGGDTIQWSHILALSSRDQESRYDRFWNVRPARSDSGLSKFTKIDVSLSVRAMLGMLNIREPQILRRQTELDSELTQLREKIKVKAAEPASQVTLLRSRLLNEFDVEQADTVPLNQGDIFGITQKRDARIAGLQAEANEVEQEIDDIDTQINGATTRLYEIHQEREQKVVAKEVTAIGSRVLELSVSPEGQRQTLLEKMDRLCPSGELVRQCEKVKEKLAQLNGEIEKKKQSNAELETLRTVQERDQVEAGLDDQAKQQEDPLSEVRVRLKKLNKQKNDLLDRRRALKEFLRVIPLVVNELLKWHRIEQGEDPNQELTTLRSEETLKVDDGEKLKSELSDLLVNQNKRIQQFQQRFHSIVQRAINTSFKGIVSVAKDELAFRISRERSLAGEAYETLAVLLADVAILMESSTESVCHPGILIHDSPREADLNIRLYERMLETVFSLMKDDQGNMPYQYIVTTTTQPSEPLRTPDVTKVTLSSGSGSLFGMQLEAGNSGGSQKMLFDGMEEA